jgi:hypothetical protein
MQKKVDNIVTEIKNSKIVEDIKKVKFIESGFYYNNSPSAALHKKAGYKPIRIKMRKKVN